MEDPVLFDRSGLDLKHRELLIYLEIKINKEKKFATDADRGRSLYVEKDLPSIHSLNIPNGMLDLDSIPLDEPDFTEETAQVKEKAKAKRAL